MATNLILDGNMTVTGTQTLSGSVAIGDASTDSIGFYGATKITQPTDASQAAVSSTAVAAVTSTAVVSVSATQWAFTSSAQGLSVLNSIGSLITSTNALTVHTNVMRAALVNLGLVKGS